jgi:MFS family permease
MSFSRQLGLHLVGTKRFGPVFATQFLNAFNDNLYKNAMVLFVVYQVMSNEHAETWFSALATGIFTIPFVTLSALSGQLADAYDKARIIRIVKLCEIGIMVVGAAGLLLALWGPQSWTWPSIILMLLALFAMGVHSTFFGPIKYAILPQHLKRDEILGGTGVIEAGTYLAILAGTILSGLISVLAAAIMVLVIAVIGYFTSRAIPPAPPFEDSHRIDWNVFRSSVRLVDATLHVPRLIMAIIAISFFWTIGAVLFILFPPLVKNVLTSDKEVASVFLGVFSIGVSIGSVAVNRMLKGEVSAKWAAPAVLAMGACIIGFQQVALGWFPAPEGTYFGIGEFLAQPATPFLLLFLLGIAAAGGMFVVPLYAFLTTAVKKSEAARTIAANNIINALAMVVGSLISVTLSLLGVATLPQLLFAAGMCLISAWLAWKLHKVADNGKVFDEKKALPDDV